ncbi:MAG: FtsX-like permease family protein [Chitinispirillaceae bacterium]|nr:FtsX-like permease family protein [Chitinispirillaceae bacterium]
MNYLISISLRNLLRHKRRSLLLGIAIAFGTAVLILANSFSRGISKVLFNEIVAYVFGHVSISFAKGANPYTQVFPDGQRMIEHIKKTAPSLRRIDESVGIFSRVIGNGKADNVMVIGVDPSEAIDQRERKRIEKNFRAIEGSFIALNDTTIENPVGVSLEKAKSLNVKLNDIIRARFTDLYGRTQTARLTVSFIYKPSNVFMTVPLFISIKNIKKLLAYEEHDIASLFLTIENPPKNARKVADILHKSLKPPLARIEGTLLNGKNKISVTVLALKTDSASRAIIKEEINFVSTSFTDANIPSDITIISNQVASALNLKEGDTCNITYLGKFTQREERYKIKVNAICDNGCGFDGNVVLVNERDFYKMFYTTWPQYPPTGKFSFVPDSTRKIYKALGGEWLLLPRAKNQNDVLKSYREAVRNGWKAILVSVDSMYENASTVVNLEIALHLITFISVMILFFIILIGVINTLRMTIRERTREIGTLRAIGMQREDVKNSFLLESAFLALFSAISGTIIAFIIMFILSKIEFSVEDNPLGILLVEGHLCFAPTFSSVLFFIIFIVLMATITAYFPAKRAAKISPVEAMRHFE